MRPGRCAIGGAAGFAAAAIGWPFLIWILTLLGLEDLPDSVFNVGTIAFLALVGAIASAGVALALPAGARRFLMVGQGALGFSVAGVALDAQGDLERLGLLHLAVAGVIVGVALGLRTPIGVLLGALVGGTTFSMTVSLTMGVEHNGGFALVAYVVGITVWGAALGATVGACEESPGWDVVARPAVLIGALALLVPTQIAAALFGPRRHPPVLCFDTREVPGGSILAVADLDGDGDLDALQRAQGGADLLRNAGGVLSPERSLAGVQVSKLGTGDVDADGDVDAVAVVIDRQTGKPSAVVAHNDGRATFTLGPRLALDREPQRVAVVDLDGDRSADVALSSFDGTTVVWSRGARLERGPRPPEWRRATLEDVDGDGRTDVVSFGGSGVEVHRVTGAAQFASAVVPVSEYVTDVAFGDVDGDGDRDLLIGAHRKVIVLANDGEGRFTPVKTLHGGRNNQWLTAGDLDGDGALDVIASDPPDDDSDGGIWVWENRGAGRWSDAGRVGTTVQPVIAADVTGDGRTDLVSGGVSTGSFTSNLLLSRPC